MENNIEVVEKIKSRYFQEETVKTDYDKLVELDKKAKRPAKIYSYIFGIIGTLVMGFGMCLSMKVLFNVMWLGVIIGLVGIVMVSCTNILHKNLLQQGKNKYSKEILDLSNKLLQK